MLESFLAAAVVAGTPLLFATLGELITEKAGNLNLGVEGMMLMGAVMGFGNWFRVQAQEEQDHAMLFLQYMLNNGEKVTLDAIAAPDVPFEDFKAPLVAALEHEQYVTASINNIYEEASKQKDYRTMQFLGWFITEQEEEERNTGDLIQQYDLFASDGKGLYLMDSELAARVHTPPSLVLD